jgi:hypothetical protein
VGSNAAGQLATEMLLRPLMSSVTD